MIHADRRARRACPLQHRTRPAAGMTTTELAEVCDDLATVIDLALMRFRRRRYDPDSLYLAASGAEIAITTEIRDDIAHMADDLRIVAGCLRQQDRSE